MPTEKTEVPTGCLGCNREAVATFLKASGFDPSAFTELPPARHNWADIVRCESCGRTWLMPAKPRSGR